MPTARSRRPRSRTWWLAGMRGPRWLAARGATDENHRAAPRTDRARARSRGELVPEESRRLLYEARSGLWRHLVLSHRPPGLLFRESPRLCETGPRHGWKPLPQGTRNA